MVHHRWNVIKIFFVFYAIICFILIIVEIFSYDSPMLSDENCTNTTAEYEEMQQEKAFDYQEIFLMIIVYPIIFIALFLGTAIYILPLLYSLLNRRLITGNFLYAKHSSDTIDLIVSLGNITENVFPCLYLSSVLYATYYYEIKEGYFT